MPRKKWSKRKSYRKRKNNTGTVVSLNSQPFPKSFITKHRYSTTVTIDPGAGAPDTLYFHANGLFDPEVAVGGHQPLGFDQMTPIYDHYTVLGSRITVNAMSAAADIGSGGSMVGVYINDDSTGSTTYDSVIEQGNGVVKALAPINGMNHVKLVKNFSAKKYFGVKDVKDNENLRGSASADPTEGAYFAVFAQGIAAASNPSAVYCNILIEYITLWTERKSLAQS